MGRVLKNILFLIRTNTAAAAAAADDDATTGDFYNSKSRLKGHKYVPRLNWRGEEGVKINKYAKKKKNK